MENKEIIKEIELLLKFNTFDIIDQSNNEWKIIEVSDIETLLQTIKEPEEKKSTIMYGEKCDHCGHEYFHEDDYCPECGSREGATEITKRLEDIEEPENKYKCGPDEDCPICN